MSKMYQEELARIMQQQQPKGRGSENNNPTSTSPSSGKLAPPGDLPAGLPGLFPGLGAAALFQRNAAAVAAASGGNQELQRAMDIYQQELAKMHQSALAAAL